MSGLQVLAGQALHEELRRCVPLRGESSLGVCLVVDADRTLCSADTGLLVGHVFGINNAIRRIFEQFGYQDEAFTAVSVQWSAIHKEAYLSELENVANDIQLRDCWVDILSFIADQVPVLVLTAGIPQIWRRVLSNAGHARVSVFGGCHQDLDEYAISAKSKGDIVSVLRELGWIVIAAGDSCIDLPMLVAANVALFVPDHKGSPALRCELAAVSSIRHLLVDDQRFDGLSTCTAMEVAEMILQGGIWRAD
ncbi:hypothetical protein [Pseudomonas capsici]|uniref:Haloacid dehalogenase-like hydrolase n=1 Tax=Pseudomonas capsici TaxID=2810614 RepID=A0ABT3BS99_9PSED|nr:hypothetical protein [Pseudomonas capsici]MCV4268050.1 hypothetical protein [Pseudomonas capsici]MCV4276875.1 hypothetical protein [Pseudomonas capsici]MCV4330426.1 hypothetical protein [Pseudomonas capsici]MCV4375720.1 hypothetical protein [Pseudomonas capsici]